MIYKGHTIEKSTSHFGGFDFFPTESGRDEVTYRADTIEEAKDRISEHVMKEAPLHEVQINDRIYPFEWIEEATGFADLWNGTMLFKIANP